MLDNGKPIKNRYIVVKHLNNIVFQTNDLEEAERQLTRSNT